MHDVRPRGRFTICVNICVSVNKKDLEKVSKSLDLLEAASGFEPLDKGFADLCLTTWLRRHIKFSLQELYRASWLSLHRQTAVYTFFYPICQRRNSAEITSLHLSLREKSHTFTAAIRRGHPPSLHRHPMHLTGRPSP